MKKVLVVDAPARREPGLTRLLNLRGLTARPVDDFSSAIGIIAESDTDASDIVGVIVNWPSKHDDDRQQQAFHTFLNKLAEHTTAHLAVILVCETMSSPAIGWLKYRKRSALLLWSDYSEIPDALSRLLNPLKEKRRSYLEELADHHLRVLFVDDSPTVRIAFRRLLMKNGFLVETATSAAEGYRKAMEGPYDMAIIDYFMPEQNGTELVARLRSQPKTNHIVPAVITGTYSDTVINDSLAAGAVECIFKNEAKDLFLARIASMARNIIDRKSINNERRRLQGILASVGDGVYGVDSKGRIQFVNPAAREILGLLEDESLVGQKAHRLFHWRFEDGSEMAEDACFLSRCYKTGNQIGGWQTTFWSRSGRMIPVECTVYPLEIQGQREGSVVAFRDVSARKLLEEELRWQATHDSLTKLPNRAQFEDELEQEVHRLKRSDNVSALLYVDLDRFKYINDTAGHSAGDHLLVEVARRLKNRLRMSDSLARIGGDEYAVILRNVREESAMAAADHFRTCLEDAPFIHAGKQYAISATIGVALMEKSSQSTGEVMANADIACHLAKMEGRNRVHLFCGDGDQRVAMDMELGWSTRLREALRENHFRLRFQPILESAGIDYERMPKEDGELWTQHDPSGSGRLACYEVLLRLADGDKMIAPDAFLPTAERFNLMVDIDRWVIDQAFAKLAAKSDCNLRFSINISEQSIIDTSTPEFVQSKLEEYGIEGHQVTFELAEMRAMSHLDATIKAVNALRALGCRFGLDDFGTGFATFSHLRELHADYLKIDGAYLRSMNDDPINTAILGAIAKIARALGKNTVAECVDSARTVRALKNSGIDQLQGFFIARPLSTLDSLPESTVVSNVTPIARAAQQP